MVVLGNEHYERRAFGTRFVQCPGIYKHFKGKYYATLGVSIGMPKDYYISLLSRGETLESIGTVKICGTEPEGYLLAIFKDEDGLLVHIVDNTPMVYNIPTRLVIYKALYDTDSPTYGRPIESFLSLTDRDKYSKKEYPQHYRMELIKY